MDNDELKPCAACNVLLENAKRCGGCRNVYYCDQTCQKAHWSVHRLECARIQAKKDNESLEKLTEHVHEQGGTTSSVPVSQNDPIKFYVVAMATRNGVHDFTKRVEDTYFPVGTPANDLLEIGTTVWLGMLYLILAVPSDYTDRVKQCAREEGMKVCDGVPTMIENGTKQFFPLRGPNVWSLENRERPAQTKEQLMAMLAKAMKKE
jgi:hypothetical protein